jgi:hypothetical protein
MKSTAVKAKKESVKRITAKEFDKKVDSGEDISSYLDFDNAVWKVNVDFPTWMVAALDKEADRLSVPRQALIKMWIDQKLKEAGAQCAIGSTGESRYK